MIAAIVLLTMAAAQTTPQAPARDATEQARGGTGIVSGQVLTADTHTPIAGTMVFLMSMPAVVQRSTTADGDGRYRFEQLPAGTYNLRAAPPSTRGQYLAGRYGAAAFDDPEQPLDLADGQRIDGADVLLPRAAAIAGRVVDGAGEPLARISVHARQIGADRHGFSAGVQTNDLGQFRLFGLSAGEYVVGAETPPFRPAGDATSEGFITTYHPGTSNVSEAARIRLRPGDEAQADVRLVVTRFFRLTGVVVNARGEPAVRPTVVALRREGLNRVTQNSAATDAQGRFVISALPPGEYRIGVLNLSGQEGTAHEFAAATVTVHDADVNDVIITTQPGVTLSGTVRYEPEPAQAVSTSLSLAPADRFSATHSVQSAQTIAGTAFTFSDVSGPALIRATASGWTLEAVVLNGRDITDVPTEFSAQDSGRLQVVMTSRAPSLEGAVTDAGGRPVRDYTMVLFGEDRSTWIPRSSMLRFANAESNGRFRIDGLREGRYFAVAVPRGAAPTPIDPDPQAFDALVTGAVSLTLHDGERRTVALRLFRAGQQ